MAAQWVGGGDGHLRYLVEAPTQELLHRTETNRQVGVLCSCGKFKSVHPLRSYSPDLKTWTPARTLNQNKRALRALECSPKCPWPPYPANQNHITVDPFFSRDEISAKTSHGIISQNRWCYIQNKNINIKNIIENCFFFTFLSWPCAINQNH